MISVAIIGATGYTGMELIRLLLNHPQAKISVVTSEKWAGQKVDQAIPAYQGRLDLTFETLDPKSVASKAELASLCLPHHESMQTAKALLDKGLKVIDLSADFRLHSIESYQAWYGDHYYPELLKEAIYGLPELHRAAIKTARLIANPGCYPTSCILALAPLLKQTLVDLESIHCDSKSGASGAGRQASVDKLFCEVSEGFKAYKIGSHRHTPEIEQELSLLANQEIKLTFTPHLLPINRGILSTCYAKLTTPLDSARLHRLYQEFYQTEPFVRLRPLGHFPSTHEVRLTNYCDLGVHLDSRTGRAIMVSAIDNLTKGASGQAVQNMNLMLGFEERLGLDTLAPLP